MDNVTSSPPPGREYWEQRRQREEEAERAEEAKRIEEAGPFALATMIDICDKVAVGAMKIEADAQIGKGLSAAELLQFMTGVREMAQNLGTMLRAIDSAIKERRG